MDFYYIFIFSRHLYFLLVTSKISYFIIYFYLKFLILITFLVLKILYFNDLKSILGVNKIVSLFNSTIAFEEIINFHMMKKSMYSK